MFTYIICDECIFLQLITRKNLICVHRNILKDDATLIIWHMILISFQHTLILYFTLCLDFKCIWERMIKVQRRRSIFLNYIYLLVPSAQVLIIFSLSICFVVFLRRLRRKKCASIRKLYRIYWDVNVYRECV